MYTANIINGTTVECRYKAVQSNMLLHTLLQWMSQSMNHSLNPQNTSHNWKKIDRIITALHFDMRNLIVTLTSAVDAISG